jgi:tRNA A37 N6-isopentenylltransferase MiaA
MKSIPHHLVNLVDTTAFFRSSSFPLNLHNFISAGDYIEAIHPVLSDIVQRKENVIPTIVGGNTMWIDWLINGVGEIIDKIALN